MLGRKPPPNLRLRLRLIYHLYLTNSFVERTALSLSLSLFYLLNGIWFRFLNYIHRRTVDRYWWWNVYHDRDIYISHFDRANAFSQLQPRIFLLLRKIIYLFIFFSFQFQSLQERESEAKRNDKGKRIDSLSKHQILSSILKLLVFGVRWYINGSGSRSKIIIFTLSTSSHDRYIIDIGTTIAEPPTQWTGTPETRTREWNEIRKASLCTSNIFNVCAWASRILRPRFGKMECDTDEICECTMYFFQDPRDLIITSCRKSLLVTSSKIEKCICQNTVTRFVSRIIYWIERDATSWISNRDWSTID